MARKKRSGLNIKSDVFLLAVAFYTRWERNESDRTVSSASGIDLYRLKYDSVVKFKSETKLLFFHV